MKMRGSYLLLLQNKYKCSVRVGKLGQIIFDPGIYVYVGSALNNIISRVNRHFKSDKKVFWHIDYITPTPMDIIGAILLISDEKLENILSALLEKYFLYIPKFGSTDTKDVSHLYYIKSYSESATLLKILCKIMPQVTSVYWYDGNNLYKIEELNKILYLIRRTL